MVGSSDPGRETDRARRALLAEIAREFEETAHMTGLRKFDPRVRQAMDGVPREAFVPTDERAYAWLNQPLPIGDGQTISQPFIVALMTALLDPAPDDVVLEVGTGSGYQAAILSLLVRKVYSVERIPELAIGAADRLERLGYANVEVCAGDGAKGWSEHAPFDRIMVTAGAAEIPEALVDQLRAGGRMVIPVDSFIGQDLCVLDKAEDGTIETRKVLPVAFVPLRTSQRGEGR